MIKEALLEGQELPVDLDKTVRLTRTGRHLPNNNLRRILSFGPRVLARATGATPPSAKRCISLFLDSTILSLPLKKTFKGLPNL